MKVKMIFAEVRPGGELWSVGSVYDAPQDVAERLIRTGRAEPVAPVQERKTEAPKAEAKAAPAKGRKR